MAYENILAETRGRVGLATLNRPKALNALNDALMNELGDALAKFGQPEIKLGIIPGAGGTQRLPRAVGKAKAMDLVLTGRMMDAAEAERSGLVSRVVSADKLLEEALAAAAQIAEFSLPSVMMAKEAVNRAYESPLAEGMLFERRVFHALFATEDQKEGMAAFVEKRKPKFKHR
ncbi:MAG: hypothetical protein E6H59_11575 [Betaproteobacteria bacterium]|nr:MAG: hypothetical protein E6H59_11575 [Betaproteobacteria bacterium]